MFTSQETKKFDACFLVDNGSLRPAATLALRSIAQKLSDCLGFQIDPVSTLHASKVPVKDLYSSPFKMSDCSARQHRNHEDCAASNPTPPACLGLERKAAEIFETAVLQRLQSGLRTFLVLPLFFGQSRALTDYLPNCFARVAKPYPKAKLTVTAPLAGLGAKPDPRISEALAERVHTLIGSRPLNDYAVVLVDHGTPLRAIAHIRDQVGAQLFEQLQQRCHAFEVSSMERRPGSDYAFNEPLLSNVLDSKRFHSGPVILAQLFLLPGRHAGPNGDIARICAAAEKTHPKLTCLRTDLLGQHPLVLEILLSRIQGALK